MKNPPKILIVDDLEVNVSILENIIRTEGYEPLCALNVQEALDIMSETMPQLILSDVTMPGMNGWEFCKLLKSNPKTRDIPVIFITVADSREEKRAAFQAGAIDFIPKPFEPIEVIMRVNNQLENYRIKQEMENYNRMMHRTVAEQQKQLEKDRENVLLALTKVMEKRNCHITGHLERVGYNSRILAQSLQLVPRYEKLVSDEFVDTISTAAKLHDIGNIIMSGETTAAGEAGPDSGYYCEEGAQILEEINAGNNNSRFLNMAILIARYHHANWDGSGYPANVAGTEIPLAARITAIANDFDKLVWENREAPRSAEEAAEMILAKGGTKYDPGIAEVFFKIKKQLKTN